MTPSSPRRPDHQPDTHTDQQHVDLLHRRIHALRERLTAELRTVLRDSAGTAQAQLERGAAATRASRRLGALDDAENGLCFGRIDRVDGKRFYIGRIGVPGAAAEDTPLLLDWRADAARPFYTATAASPLGVRLRRHLHTRNARVLRVDDELFGDPSTVPDNVQLSGEAALLAALQQGKTGRMRDAVATLQAEQDRIVRSQPAGVMVVQGGPGTGKTVVALHRAAYLLYSHQRLQRSGVLVVGPNAVFLEYVSQVLPGLGETSVLLSSIGDLYPGVVARAEDRPDTAAVKGGVAMVEVLEHAVRARQAAVSGPVDVAVGGELVRLTRGFLADAAARATGGGRGHNLARDVFREAVLDEVADQLARVIGDIEAGFEEVLAEQLDVDTLDREVQADLASVFGDDVSAYDFRAQLPAEFAERRSDWLEKLPQDPSIRRAVDVLWPLLTPEGLLTDLFTDPVRLAEAAPQLTEEQRALLRRDADAPWTLSDVPLLDEAAELIGADDRAETERDSARRAARRDYAQGVLDIARSSRVGEGTQDEELDASDLIDAERLAAWHEAADARTIAERAASDRSWVFGHVIVDEAQDVSPMTWRLLVRRCPTRSFTVVGDSAQSSAAAGSTSWEQALEPFFGTRWRQETLSINYRTPVEIASASAPVLREIAPELDPARAVQTGADRPHYEQTTPEDLPGRLAAVTAGRPRAGAGGRFAVIVPSADLEHLAARIAADNPGASWGHEVDLAQDVVVLTAPQAKGLEFDTVVVADPRGIVESSPRGLNDLYVALTRASHRLHVLHPGLLPRVLEDDASAVG